MTWLITGGCGFVGSNLANALMSKGKQVVVVDNLSRVGSTDNQDWLRVCHGHDWRFIQADVRDQDTINRIVIETQPRVIVHLAGQVAMTTSIQNPVLDFEVNARGTLNILEATRHHSPDSIVLYSSTNKIYGDLEWIQYQETDTRYIAPRYPDGFDESLPLDFHSPYGCSKGSADQYMLDYARIFSLRTIVFRHSSMYGGRQFATYDQGWIGWFCQQAINKRRNPDAEAFTISGNGKQVRDVLHEDDLTRLYIKAVEHIDTASGQAFNIGGGMVHSLSLLELFAQLEALVGIKLVYTRLAPRASDQLIFVANTHKAARLLNWQPHISVQDGLTRTLEWLESR